jgi:uncharacterized membrane protein YeaQ/YmgE (transglycosylase-associated protein family)
MVFSVLGLLLVGLVAGAIARLFVSSPHRLGCLGTALLGLVGSYAGGTLAAVLFHDRLDLSRASTIVGAIVGSMLVLAGWRLVSHTPRR